MLARLQSAIGRDDLIEQMVLMPEAQKSFSERVSQAKSANFIVGYNGSPQSHTALDIACWIAHQTSLATNSQITVQAVYVVEENFNCQSIDIFNVADSKAQLECQFSNISKPVLLRLNQTKGTAILPQLERESITSINEADRIIWQAKTLAQEWQGSFKSHLRFGNIAKELKKVVQLESADILFLGCQSSHHPMIETLGKNFPCTVLGIPHCID
ncbi:universal stress protein [Dolichospermum sp. UHCC 0259]|uniref:universal stress protein n=1 Tax=Dolichospermum sp. UHCC 0259 TaxID=2590010 RepID=UPI001447F4B2|nr:universal stress protein [Dolichospermum sp. UHCC 0259]MTJ48907.1 universal stress protein [Dolichospermum sp. UHCC 0259]